MRMCTSEHFSMVREPKSRATNSAKRKTPGKRRTLSGKVSPHSGFACWQVREQSREYGIKIPKKRKKPIYNPVTLC